MPYFLLLLSLFLTNTACAQDGYSTIIRKTDEIKPKTNDTVALREALKGYNKAFNTYPDSIKSNDLYRASIYAVKVNDITEAFKYLTPLALLDEDEDGYPGWTYLDDDFFADEYKILKSDQKWRLLKQKTDMKKSFYLRTLKSHQKEFFARRDVKVKSKHDLRILFNDLKYSNPYLKKNCQNYSISFKINDTANTSYFVHLPKAYDCKKKYGIMFFLHGAIRYATLSNFQVSKQVLGGWNRFYTKYADSNQVILVFPSGSSQFNWMTPDDGFYMIPKMLRQLKIALNIDDGRVFISGHSNGATGSFSYLMKNPNDFAGFYGFNTQPKVYTGGTFITNILNRSFINISTDQDYYFPPEANDDLNKLMQAIHADYHDYRFKGFPHWFPQFDAAESAFKIIFSDIKKRRRNPYPSQISWTFDDNKYGHVDWLNNIKLDTSSTINKTENEVNFKIYKWLFFDKNDSLVEKKVDKYAFDFPRKSGKITASYHDNVFNIKVINIKSFNINLLSEFVDFNKHIKVYVNGKLYFNRKLSFNQVFMFQNFRENLDRSRVYVNFISVKGF